MVNYWIHACLLLADEPKRTALERLDPERRAAVILSLVGLGLLGVLLVVVTMLAGRWARQHRSSRSSRLDLSTTKQRKSQRRRPNHQASRGETMVDTPGEQDTKS